MNLLPLKNSVQISVNGYKKAVPQAISLADLLQSLSLTNQRIAVAVNNTIVPKSQFSVHTLVDGDHVEILEAVGGG